MIVSHALAEASQILSSAYARYAMQAAVLATRTAHLHDQVVGCIARGQLTPASVDASLQEFAIGGAKELAATARTALAGFAEGLAEGRIGPSSSEVERIENDLAGVASGDVTVGQAKRRYRAAIDKSVAANLVRGAEGWFELLAELDALRASAAERVLLGLMKSAFPIGYSDELIRLAAPIEETASAEVQLDNQLAEPMTVRCTVGDLRRADAVDRAFRPNVVVTPSELLLAPLQSATVGLSLAMDGGLYEAGVSYVGTVRIARGDEPGLDVPLCVLPSA